MKRVLPLTLGSLALGLDAYVVAGILPVVGHDLHTTTSAAGQLVTVFTLSYGLLSPVFATLLARRPVRMVLLAALAVFTAGNLLSAVAGSFALLLVSRAVAGLGAGVYSPMAAAAAAGLVPPERRGRALALVTAGMTVGAAAGVPLGLTLAESTGWRSTMWLITGLGVVAMAGVASLLPAGTPASPPPLRARLAVLTDRRVVAVAAVMLLAAAASVGLYTYIAPLMAATLHVTELSHHLWLWGLGGLVGSQLVGVLVDAWRDTRALVSVILGVLGVTLAVFPFVATTGPGATVALLVWGALGWGCLAPQIHRMLALRGADGPLAVSLNSSALYLGSAVGAGVGGALIGAGLAVTTLAMLYGAVALTVALLNLFLTPASAARRPATALPPRGEPACAGRTVSG
ncbi:MFS transporter [Sphaerisporangium fuscum]|uniref:MFS transporter n=1 Tax=Sphaerisporangium fuscum TaxID=2835868 RepID=UPI001BDBED14|nr:MFS transporter [Sphaerisporangium fuscum]